MLHVFARRERSPFYVEIDISNFILYTQVMFYNKHSRRDRFHKYKIRIQKCWQDVTSLLIFRPFFQVYELETIGWDMLYPVVFRETMFSFQYVFFNKLLKFL